MAVFDLGVGFLKVFWYIYIYIYIFWDLYSFLCLFVLVFEYENPFNSKYYFCFLGYLINILCGEDLGVWLLVIRWNWRFFIFFGWKNREIVGEPRGGSLNIQIRDSFVMERNGPNHYFKVSNSIFFLFLILWLLTKKVLDVTTSLKLVSHSIDIMSVPGSNTWKILGAIWWINVHLVLELHCNIFVR